MSRVVETDNHGGDYPAERFTLGNLRLPHSDCQAIADIINKRYCRNDYAPRFWKVVDDNYKLAPGFEP